MITRTIGGNRGRPRIAAAVESAIVTAWPHLTAGQLAERHGVSLSTVFAVGRRQHLTRKRSGHMSKAIHGTRACYQMGCRRAECRAAASAYAKAWKWTHRTRTPRGQAPHTPRSIPVPTQYRCQTCDAPNCDQHRQAWEASA